MKLHELRPWVALCEDGERRILERVAKLPGDTLDMTAAQERELITARQALDLLRDGPQVGLQGSSTILDALEFAGVDVSDAPPVRLPLNVARRRLAELEAEQVEVA